MKVHRLMQTAVLRGGLTDGLNSTGLSLRRPLFMSCVKPKVNVYSY